MPLEIERQMASRPTRVALIDAEHRAFTFGELADRTAKTGWGLISAGVKRGQIVALAIPRSVEMVAGMLGVEQAGAAFLPLSPELPDERVAHMLQASQASVILTVSALRDRYARFGLPVCVPELGGGPAVPLPAVPSAPLELAYIVFTSGSTGQPKGVMCARGGLSNRLGWAIRHYELNEETVSLQLASLSFDVAFSEIYTPLMVGGRVVLADAAERQNGPYLRDVIQRHGVSVLEFIPAALQGLLDSEGAEDCRSIRTVVVGGETLPPRTVARMREVLPSARLFNVWGATEASIDSSCHACGPADAARTVPIGTAIDRTQLHVLDGDLRPVTPGEAGEIFIGGEGVGWGYVGRPDLTADRFVPDPFREVRGGRLYRTGDLGRWRGDGALEFLGRNDRQVKVRGYRIELDEVEAALARHPSVEAAAVLVVGTDQSTANLMAHVEPVAGVLKGPAEAQALQAALHDHLTASLPPYMVPRWIRLTAALPRNANGKVDMPALKATPEAGEEVKSRPPGSPMERMLVSHWEATLGSAGLGLDSDFFGSGGTSLTATQLITSLGDALEERFHLRDIYDAPTPGAFAAQLERHADYARMKENAELWEQVQALSDEEARRELAPQRD